MSTPYKSINPLAQREEYVANENVDFIGNIEQMQLDFDTLRIHGEYALFADITTNTPATQDEEVMIDSDAAAHSFMKNVKSYLNGPGEMESIENYPKLMKGKHSATKFLNSMGTESDNAIESCAPNQTVSRGLAYGSDDENWVPFTIRPEIALNKVYDAMGNPSSLKGRQIGGVFRVSFTLPANSEVLFGTDVSLNSGYKLRKLQLTFSITPDDGQPLQPLVMQKYDDIRQSLNGPHTNLSANVQLESNGFHGFFTPVSEESNILQNFLAIRPLPGIPLNSTDGRVQNYGLERLFVAINDTETSFDSYTLESRNDIIYNYLQSWRSMPVANHAGLSRLMAANPDCYGIGKNFRGYRDLSVNKFTIDMESEATTDYSVYLFFKGRTMLPGGK